MLNVNSTASGGGVAEMLRTLLAYARGAGVDAQWVVIQGDPHFFEITKRIHNNLHGAPGDGGPLGENERRHYEEILRANADELLALVRPSDIVLLHDPQTAGLGHALARAGVIVVWRCHVGADALNEHTERAWAFLRPYLDDVDAYVFSRAAYAPDWAEPQRTFVIPPSIDPFSAKNQPMSPADVEAVLHYVGLLAGEPPASRGGIHPRGRVDQSHQSPRRRAPDRPAAAGERAARRPGVAVGSAQGHGRRHDGVRGARRRRRPAHLLLVGPVVTGVSDDPEGAATFDHCIEVWRRLPHAERSRIHLACLPMQDPIENAIIVNAVQRHASVVTQKSLAEGFGLTVAEAMWKGRPIVASAVGGIVDQIVSGEHGLLVDDPRDPVEFGQAVRRLLEDPPYAELLGENARQPGHGPNSSVTATSSSTRSCSSNSTAPAEGARSPRAAALTPAAWPRCGRRDGRG